MTFILGGWHSVSMIYMMFIDLWRLASNDINVSGLEMGRHPCFGHRNGTTSMFRVLACDDVYVSGLEMGRRIWCGHVSYRGRVFLYIHSYITCFVYFDTPGFGFRNGTTCMFRVWQWDDVLVSELQMRRHPCFGSGNGTTSKFRSWTGTTSVVRGLDMNNMCLCVDTVGLYS